MAPYSPRRNIGLRMRGRTQGRPGSGSGWDEPNAPSSGVPVQPLAPQSGTFPLPAPTGFGDDGVVQVPPAALGNAPAYAAPVPSPNPGDVVLGANRDPARAMPAANPFNTDVTTAPLPPRRPSDLGSVLAGAVQPSVPYPPPRPQAAVAASPAVQSPWVVQDMQNSDPNARFRPQMGMLDLSKLFGGR